MKESSENDSSKENITEPNKKEKNIDNINNENSKTSSNTKPMFWKEECIKGNLMPGIIMLEQKK